jgi:hypothetical protein
LIQQWKGLFSYTEAQCNLSVTELLQSFPSVSREPWRSKKRRNSNLMRSSSSFGGDAVTTMKETWQEEFARRLLFF